MPFTHHLRHQSKNRIKQALLQEPAPVQPGPRLADAQVEPLKKTRTCSEKLENNYLAIQWFSVIFAEMAVFAFLVFTLPLITLSFIATAVATTRLYQLFTNPPLQDSPPPNASTDNLMI